MANLSGQPELDDVSLETAEARMRRALGDLDTHAAANGRAGNEAGRVRTESRAPERHSGDRPRARFVQDGDVPVTVLNRTRPHEADASGGNNRLSVAEAALATERTARLRAERALSEAQATVHDLQTKWGHTELARQDLARRLDAEKASFEVERSALQARELSLTEELATERMARIRAEAGARPARREPAEQPTLAGISPAMDAGLITPARMGADKATPKRLGRPRQAGAKRADPKPVKWWLGGTKKK